MLKLDVGCGDLPRGDVNCDLFIKRENPHLRPSRPMDVRQIKNFVRCDSKNLPFRDKIFSESSCHHVIEHEGVNPVKTLRELARVTSGIISIRVPHRFNRGSTLRHRQHPKHDKYFSITLMKKLLNNLGLNAQVTCMYRPFPSPLFPLIQVPNEIRAEIFVR